MGWLYVIGWGTSYQMQTPLLHNRIVMDRLSILIIIMFINYNHRKYHDKTKK
jgi:hypothetical protein